MSDITNRILELLAHRLAKVEAAVREPGPAGEPGADGAPGARGDDGTPGLSAYGLWLAAGNEGSEADFLLALAGAAGRDGTNGTDGINGADGAAGEQGPPGPMGPIPDHRWSGTSLQFEKPDGSWGKSVDLQGPKGAGGTSGYIVQGGDGAGIDDSTTSTTTTWSSEKIAQQVVTGSGDLSYEHTQASAADTWTVVHNLGKYPSVNVKDSGGDEVEGDLTYTNVNSLVLRFSAAFAGVAYLN